VEALEACQGAYTELARRYQDVVYRQIVWMLGGELDLADDLTRLTVVKAFQRLVLYRPEFPFAEWIRRIAHNTCIHYFRQQQREARERAEQGILAPTPQRLAGIAVPNAISHSDPRRVNFLMLERSIKRAARHLKGTCRCCFEMHVLEGRSPAEIAEALNLPPAAVRAYISRGRKRVGKLLGHWSKYLSLDTPQPA
jgi:RNA polymerase sigma-70 factor (ECF subfamily)